MPNGGVAYLDGRLEIDGSMGLGNTTSSCSDPVLKKNVPEARAVENY